MLTQLLNLTKESNEGDAEEMMARPTSRRGLLVGGLTAALGATTGIAAAQNLGGSGSSGPRALPPGAKPPGTGTFTNNASGFGNGGTSINRTWGDVKKRLLRRISYGATQQDISEINAVGYDIYLETQLNFEDIDDSACEAQVLADVPNVNMTLQEINQLSQGNAFMGWDAAVQATIIRSVKSKRQLYQRMVEFWHDHFYVYSGTHLGVGLHYQREVIWNNAMGSFKDLLTASANHGLMMLYLDNRLSTDRNINVNYAREILELHTVGVNGGYSEADIYELANIFTGWGVETSNANLLFGSFKYTNSQHAQGTRTVMGQSFAQAGKAQGDAAISWLASHPATIKYIADKLSWWFLGTPASVSLFQQIAAVWGTDGDIKSVLRVILSQFNMAQVQPIFKRPFHLIVGAIRQAESNITSAYWVYEYLKESGHSMGAWIQPDGFPDGFAYWSGGMVKRFKLMTHFSRGRLQNAPSVDLSSMNGMTDGEKMAFINNKFFLGELPVSDQIWIRRYLKGTTNHKQAVAISLCSPSYQWF
ncbi:MAG: DUF1800 domain-containing protein [Fimbriimonadaceae bacterium]